MAKTSNTITVIIDMRVMTLSAACLPFPLLRQSILFRMEPKILLQSVFPSARSCYTPHREQLQEKRKCAIPNLNGSDIAYRGCAIQERTDRSQMTPAHRKEKSMVNRSDNEKMQQPESLTPEELRQFLLAELEVGKQVIEALNDEQLEEVVGGVRNYTAEEHLIAMRYDGSPLSIESILRLHNASTVRTPSPATPHSEVETDHTLLPGGRPSYIIAMNVPPLMRSLSAGSGNKLGQPPLERSSSAHF
jgi:hypothetical protein